jgi:hypothetical protein
MGVHYDCWSVCNYLPITTRDPSCLVCAFHPAAAAPALRVATVAAGPNGPSVTLAGQLNSVADLAAAMAASKELLAALSPEQVTHAQRKTH